MNSDYKLLHKLLKGIFESDKEVFDYDFSDLLKGENIKEIDIQRLVSYLKEQKFIVKKNSINNLPVKCYSITVEGRNYLLSGGFYPSYIQRFKRWSKSDSGYGNSKWIITVILTGISITLSIIAILNTHFKNS